MVFTAGSAQRREREMVDPMDDERSLLVTAAVVKEGEVGISFTTRTCFTPPPKDSRELA
jgi:hypothetical protein